MNRIITFCMAVIGLGIFLSACSNQQHHKETQVHRNLLQNVRLGDGIPLDLNVTLRWTPGLMTDITVKRYHPDSFNQQIIIPRSLELTKQVSNKFPSVDSVFSVHRDLYIEAIKDILAEGLTENGIDVKDVIIADIGFPPSYISAKETVGLKDQELEKIRQQNIIKIEEAKAMREQADADGKVKIAQAEADSKVQEIKAKTEKNRRKAEVAVAETEAQVERMKAKAEADKNRALADAEVEKARKLKNIEVEKKKELEQIAVDKVSQLDRVEFERQIQLAKLCQENPTYATFLVNKELASKVDIAVLPTGGEKSVFDNIINQNMPGN